LSEQNYGLTAFGYNPKPIDVIEEEYREFLQQNFGNYINVTSQSAMFKIVRVKAVQDNQLWVKSEEIFYNCFIKTAEGAALDLKGKDLGLERKPAFESTVTLTIIKDTSDAVTVPLGSLFQTSEAVIFQTTEAITIPAGDPGTTEGTVNAQAIIAGTSGNVGADTITLPVYTISGVDSSTNDVAAEGGTDKETDDDYKLRLDEYVKSVWTSAAIISAAKGVPGVENVKLIEAATSYTLLVVPTNTLTSEIEDNIDDAVNIVNPVTVEYTIVEAKEIIIDVTATVVLFGIDLSTANSEGSIEIATYINSLGIDDDVFESKVIQAILEVNGINNVYDVTLEGKIIAEKHTYNTGTDTYALDYQGDDIIEVRGTLSSSPHTFVETTDYVLLSSPTRIDWSPAGDNPDNGTEFEVDYDVPPNAIGDVIVNEDSVATTGIVNLSEP
jgi:uncharacterized phage protein gp47/JayE